MFRIIKKGDKLYSIIYNCCPRCQSDKFWPKNNPYKNILVNNGGDIGSCNNCKLKYEIEPGFWYGAMYVSYGLTVFVALLTWLIMYILNKEMDIFTTGSSSDKDLNYQLLLDEHILDNLELAVLSCEISNLCELNS